jgi:hypothetical protein
MSDTKGRYTKSNAIKLHAEFFLAHVLPSQRGLADLLSPVILSKGLPANIEAPLLL